MYLALLVSILLLGWWLTLGDRGRSLAWETVRLSALTCAVSVPAGTVLALLLLRTNLPGRRVLMTITLSLLLMPLYLQAAAWDAGFGRAGWLSFWDETMNEPLLRGRPAAVWIHAMAAIPWVILIVSAGLRYVSRQWEEAAMLDGSGWQVIRRVTLRRALPAICVAALWVAVATAGEMTVTDMYGVRTYAEELYTGFALGDDPGQAWRIMLTALPLLLTLTLLVLAGTARWTPPDLTSVNSPLQPFLLGAAKWPAFGLVASCVALLAGVPLGNLIYKAGIVVREEDGERVRSWLLPHFTRMVASSVVEFRTEIIWSLVLATLCAMMVVPAGIALAWSARHRYARLAVLTLCAFCLAMPGPLVGLTSMWIFNREPWTWLYDQTAVVTAGTIGVKCLPLVTLILWYAFQSIPSKELDLARLDGVGSIGQLCWLVLPQRKGAVLAAILVTMVLSMGDIAAGILVRPAGLDLLSVHVFGLIHFGVEDRLAGLCLLITGGYVAISLLLIACFLRPNLDLG